MASHNEKSQHYGQEQVEYIEKPSRKDSRASVAEEVLDLSGIEATAASKAAWLISLTISQAGLLFGYDTGMLRSMTFCKEPPLIAVQVIFPPCSLLLAILSVANSVLLNQNLSPLSRLAVLWSVQSTPVFRRTSTAAECPSGSPALSS